MREEKQKENKSIITRIHPILTTLNISMNYHTHTPHKRTQDNINQRRHRVLATPPRTGHTPWDRPHPLVLLWEGDSLPSSTSESLSLDLFLSR